MKFSFLRLLSLPPRACENKRALASPGTAGHTIIAGMRRWPEVVVFGPVVFGLVAFGSIWCQQPAVPTFGTTVVDSAGLRGTIYFLEKNTGILPDSFRRKKPKGTIYTHSLNVPPRDFMEGFPGVTK